MSTNQAGQSSLSYTQGFLLFLLGQLSIVILIGAFIKYFIFGDTPNEDASSFTLSQSRRRGTLGHKSSLFSLEQRQRSLRRKRSSVLRNPPPLTTATILSKTYYNVNSHQPESLDWFNVLVAQTIAQFRSDAQHDDAILRSLSGVLNGPQIPDFLDEIKITEVSLGEDFPIFSNCRVIPVDEDGIGGSAGTAMGEGGGLQARMDVDLSDLITLGVETKLILNYPKPRVAVLPVALSVSVVRFSGTLSISFIPSSPSTPSPTTLAFSFLDDYRLDLSIRSLVGSRSRLQDVPKIAQLVEQRLHSWFDERCVEPRFQQIVMPSLWPRKKNTRGGDDEDVVVGSDRRESRAETRGDRENEREEGERIHAEGLRRRAGGGFSMPGTMPDILMA
ncbi:ERMES complex subunit mmm1 [Trichoglossum hirsutum]|uniref:Maintenance of mitochondrial morphology protein 1 n=1 Tax=Trichoglossum hirsutum TaxID=265104 RepID=A0A9P8LF33_9PEZI|nr:ERMES complex subunit mmm1 [Trichoglossum hirsutum]